MANCKGQKFGHNFPFPGADCINGCGTNQAELSKTKKSGEVYGIKWEVKKKLPKDLMRTIHTPEHLLAKDISEYCNEKKAFAKYLGIINRIGRERAYQIFSEIKQSKGIKSPAKIFMWKASRKGLSTRANPAS